MNTHIDTNFHFNLTPEDISSKQDIQDQYHQLNVQEELSPALKKLQESYEEMRKTRLEARRKYNLLTPEKKAEQDISTKIILNRMNDIPLNQEERERLHREQSRNRKFLHTHSS